MKNFEYLVETECTQHDLNMLGEDGWELVAVSHQVFYLKRKKIEKVYKCRGGCGKTVSNENSFCCRECAWEYER